MICIGDLAGWNPLISWATFDMENCNHVPCSFGFYKKNKPTTSAPDQ